MKKSTKLKTSFSLSKQCKLLLVLLSTKLGISQASTIEMLVREKARAEGINNARSD